MTLPPQQSFRGHSPYPDPISAPCGVMLPGSILLPVHVDRRPSLRQFAAFDYLAHLLRGLIFTGKPFAQARQSLIIPGFHDVLVLPEIKQAVALNFWMQYDVGAN